MNFRYAGNIPNRKKGGFFPIRDRSVLATFDDQCEDDEESFLLDPIRSRDVGLIIFNEEGNVQPLKSASSWDRMRAQVSIKRFKLNDGDISEARRKVWQDMIKEIKIFEKALLKESRSRDNKTAQKWMDTSLDNIIRMTNKQTDLSSVASWCLKVHGHERLKDIIR